MALQGLIEQIKVHEAYERVGMILTHLGVVRATSRDGRPVRELTVQADRERLAGILAEQKRRPGIVEILVEIREGRRLVGDEIMAVVVAGDIREHCFPVLIDTVEAIKREVTRKQER